MTDDKTRNSLEETIAQLAKRLESGANLAHVKDREEWEQIVARKPPEERELLQELARFVDLWRYFRERNERSESTSWTPFRGFMISPFRSGLSASSRSISN